MMKKGYLDNLLFWCENFQMHYSFFHQKLELLDKDSVAFDEMSKYNDLFLYHKEDGKFLHSCVNEAIEYIGYVRGTLRRHYEDYSISFLKEKSKVIEANIDYVIKELYEFTK